MSADTPLLSVERLEKHYPVTKGVLKDRVGTVRAVDGIDFTVNEGETIGIVGESGCGKSTAATSLLRIEEPTSGAVRYRGEDICEYDSKELKRFRRHAQMIFQDPTSSFDPRMSIGESIAEPLVIHGMRDRSRRRAIVRDLLERVGLSADDIDRYPHEFSGGQKQRVAIARALSVNPDVIVADEPVSALDVSVQAEILNLIDEIQTEFGLAIVFISHNMGVIREICDYVNVMYLGEIVESGTTEEIFENPQHPYTQALLSSILEPDPTQRGESTQLSGDVPSPANPPSGCRFHTRCPQIIQPEGYDFEQAEWRDVMDFRVQLRTDIDLDAVKNFVGVTEDASEAELPYDAMKAAIRDEFDLPEELSDAAADGILEDALDSVVRDRQDAARELLAEEFHTPCESEQPALEETGADHPAACLLHQRSETTLAADD